MPQDLNLKKSIYFSLVNLILITALLSGDQEGTKLGFSQSLFHKKNVSDLCLKSLELVNMLRVTLRVPLMNIAFSKFIIYILCVF